MAETQKASVGWNGEVFLGADATATGAIELVEVVSFGLPSSEGERVETTHLKSPNRRREYTSGMIDGGEIEVVLNFRPGSDTDVFLDAAQVAGDERYVRFNVPELGVLSWTYVTTVIVTSYDRGTVSADEKMEATVTMAVTGDVTGSAYVAPV